MSSAETAEPIEMPFRLWTRVVQETTYYAGVRIPQGKGRLGGHLPAHREVFGISGVGQSYSVGGSSDAAFRCQYCSNLLYFI